jgi:UDPglucose--hexose-1-phosphate uridylyltransferase
MAERRRNPLTGDWVIVSPGRIDRPWQGSEEPTAAPVLHRWESSCYLCPRNTRANGAVNPDYAGAFAFDNDFPALDTDAHAVDTRDPLLQATPITGRCRVLCYSERHDATLASLSPREITGVIELWRAESLQLRRHHAWVQIFENKGALMGCSSPHPHGQVWATSEVPTLAAREDQAQHAYTSNRVATSPPILLLDYARRELALAERVVAQTDRWVVVVPYWAAWPFETLVLPLSHRCGFEDLDPHDVTDLAYVLGRLLPAYDRLFDVSFPYSMGWHGRGRDHGPHWQLHAHVYPPLLRSASVRKFMVGFEMLAEAQRDLSPEDAAARLRQLVRR